MRSRQRTRLTHVSTLLLSSSFLSLNYKKNNLFLLIAYSSFDRLMSNKESKPKLNWWKPYWIATIIVVLVLGFANYFLFSVPLFEATVGLLLTFGCLGVAYYTRVRPSLKVNKALYVLLGVTPIGLVIWIVFSVAFSRLLISVVGALPSIILSWLICLPIGAIIGYYIGKRRNIALPFSP